MQVRVIRQVIVHCCCYSRTRTCVHTRTYVWYVQHAHVRAHVHVRTCTCTCRRCTVHARARLVHFDVSVLPQRVAARRQWSWAAAAPAAAVSTSSSPAYVCCIHARSSGVHVATCTTRTRSVFGLARARSARLSNCNLPQMMYVTHTTSKQLMHTYTTLLRSNKRALAQRERAPACNTGARGEGEGGG